MECKQHCFFVSFVFQFCFECNGKLVFHEFGFLFPSGTVYLADAAGSTPKKPELPRYVPPHTRRSQTESQSEDVPPAQDMETEEGTYIVSCLFRPFVSADVLFDASIVA